MDIGFAALLLAFLAPILLIISLAIRLDSAGPVIFKQRRIGRNGKPFGSFKFRTMYIDAWETSTGPIFKISKDQRITKVGSFLRKTALDELPVLFNVLNGDMSLVGPRPALPFEIERYTIPQRKRLEIRPGVTGYWQTYGREAGKLDFQQMIEMDLEYVEKQSIWLDLKILGRTALLVSQQKAAY